VDEANRALPLVGRIVSDIVTRYRQVRQYRRQRALFLRQGQRSEADALENQGRAAAERLDEFVAELGELSVRIEDLDVGLVDFPSRRSGQPILLCWKLGEPRVSFWHALNGRFADRRPIDEACK
jgi:hypothetical protein